jgi:membrane protein YdbS with pleckstrin-like domain
VRHPLRAGVPDPLASVGRMPYPRKNLNPNETVALDMHPHWWFLSGPVSTLALSIVVGVVVLVEKGDSTFWDLISWVVLVLIALALLWSIGRYLKWVTTNFVITSQRLIFRQGVFAKSGIEIPLERVNNVNFGQSVLERVLGAGDLLIESGGEDGQQRFTDIRHPDQVQNLIHAQMEGLAQRRSGYRPSGPTNVDVTAQLERLEGLLERGSITPDEFEAQKRKLLD